MGDLVSIIIPFYNVEDYIEECLKSVINQTYKNLEIICVDDCSPDNSYIIVNKYIDIDKRIKLIRHKENLGLGGARNTGLQNANGKFVYFLDSDDYIENDYIEKMVLNIKDADVICNNKMLKFYEDGSKKFIDGKDIKNKYQVLDYTDDMYNLMLTSACSKMYRKDFLINNNLFFPNKLRFEDFYFINILKTKLRKIVFIYNSTYYYRQRKTSIIGQYKIKNNQKDSIYIIESIYKYYKDNNLLDKYNVPFKWLYKFFRRQQNKQEFFIEVKNLLNSIKEDINIDDYNKKNKIFFKAVLSSNSYFIFKIKYLVGRFI